LGLRVFFHILTGLILDLSKILIYTFHYNYAKKNYCDKAKLLYSDTDSLIYEIQTEDFYVDIARDVDLWFDTSEYPKELQIKK